MNQKPSGKTQLRRLALDLGPLIIFFAANKIWGIYTATGIFMVATLVSLGIGYAIERKLSPMPVFSAVLVLAMGGLAIYLKDATFIKMKPTIFYAFSGLLLLVGLAFDHVLIKYAFGTALDLTEEGWRKLTFRWGVFLLGLAALNEIVWRNFSTDVWVSFKLFGAFPLFFLFAVMQIMMLQEHIIPDDEKS